MFSFVPVRKRQPCLGAGPAILARRTSSSCRGARSPCSFGSMLTVTTLNLPPTEKSWRHLAAARRARPFSTCVQSIGQR